MSYYNNICCYLNGIQCMHRRVPEVLFKYYLVTNRQYIYIYAHDASKVIIQSLYYALKLIIGGRIKLEEVWLKIHDNYPIMARKSLIEFLRWLYKIYD